MRVALTGLTIAEYFRDIEKQDVLLFIDNIYRFTQAGSEVSALLGRMPSAVGINQHLRQKWVNYKNVSVQLKTDLLHLFKRFTCQPMTILTRLQQQHSLT